MNINVTKDEVIIINSDIPHENEYHITTCHFNFDEFTNNFQVKRVIFTVLSNGCMYESDIIDNKCNVPIEVLKHEYETIKLGVYGFNIGDDEELENRFSPTPDKFVVPSGSYQDGAESPEPITPSQYDIYSDRLQEGLNQVDKTLNEVNEKIDDVKEIANDVTKKGDNAEEQGNYAKEQGNYAKDVGEQLIKERDEGLFNGEDGYNGKDGYTPTKGIDYFTPSEINEIESDVKEQIKNDLNFDKTIDDITQDISGLQEEQTSQNTQIDKNKDDIATINNNLVNYSLVTETGNKISLIIDNSNFQFYAQLKDKNGNVINTSNVIDLPIEQLVMNVAYDNIAKEITITLQNGEITKVPVAAIISGLVSESQLNEILDDYVKNTDYATSNKGGVVKTGYSFLLNSDGVPNAQVRSYSIYQTMYNENFISKGTLENVITGKGLVSDTDYASSSKGGVVVSGGYGIVVNESGQLRVGVYDYEQYTSSGNNNAIGKGTLENVITGKKLVNKTYVDEIVGDISQAIDLINGETLDDASATTMTLPLQEPQHLMNVKSDNESEVDE